MNATTMPGMATMVMPMTSSSMNSSHDFLVSMCANMTAMMMNCSNMNGMNNMNHNNGMNMSGMNHNGMNMNGMHGMMMPMFFQTGKDLTILFEGWKTDTVGELIGSLIALFFMAFIYEGIKIFREELKKREYKNFNGNGGGNYDLREKNGVQPANGNGHCHEPKFIMTKSRILSTLHLLQTFLHMVQVFIGYMLMLAVMTYNVWIFLAVIVGAGAGYFAFGWKRVSIVDVGDHCL